MSGRLLRLVCTAAMAAGTLLAPVPALAAPDPSPSATQSPGEPAAAEEPSVTALLTDLQRLYREAEQATETYDATAERLKRQRAEVRRLDGQLVRARLSLHERRGALGRLARQQYQSSSAISPYVQLLLARDPQHALEQGHVIRQLALERAETVGRLVGGERRTDVLARAARAALDQQLTLAERQKRDRDAVRERLRRVEELLATLSTEQLAELAELEQKEGERGEVAGKEREFITSGALSAGRKPSGEGERALRQAVAQLGKPYEWGAEGPASFDCSGLTSQAWEAAGRPIPRTSQEQWARLPHIPLAELRPGDLVVYFPEATHVALYLGDGMVVQAPRPGAEVKVSPLSANPVLGAVRPDPDGEPLTRYTPPKIPADATAGSDEGYSLATKPADSYAPAPVTEPR
ncbi:NlpC/P60 family protein [Streptomyces turgidiscabies]|uniref:NlpC/P60 family protein n=1 Tax=Streptomyces turgidiscabies (strain Car8) TaxID=698760 RepID=L7ET48_STRT8|nr:MULTISPECIES: C40 family peptidase [Streptomyces]ELP61565.1 NlpC/P60 family protein [Streptomyces turgidiscabies Car8]MDX3495522.1 NlpC/P60 family protein [Streptomyces turgidiscabies]GAQ70210.1 putative endopeptidase precursor [Streptomyces turgidiscabies]